ncbi:uncharacterized protein ASPGLDRAFT_86250 [Aspergillus glaucus CBS 516.65]|uniref:Uncharacterized protein n=1 Tax=Aspergillus glaucus CBS 516.65 TaxID=1160497 RepID=A0A1L9V4I4_ASPGL|nr:hypothetical protein ASPGLDRAFT_86250 [Aspergillus glaucus CBS 516.65]OJJ78828.1 hypothetical protein ASPGLDRAFT_86250 [Aspergillus glaucus CBS 516.65]
MSPKSNGPHRILSQGLIPALEQLDLTIEIHEIPLVDDFEGEIGRSFEVMRRTSQAVTEIVARGSYPLILSGNCMATPAVACGLQNHNQNEELGFNTISMTELYIPNSDELEYTVHQITPGVLPSTSSHFFQIRAPSPSLKFYHSLNPRSS